MFTNSVFEASVRMIDGILGGAGDTRDTRKERLEAAGYNYDAGRKLSRNFTVK